jgi:hypothetical protein
VTFVAGIDPATGRRSVPGEQLKTSSSRRVIEGLGAVTHTKQRLAHHGEIGQFHQRGGAEAERGSVQS